MSVEIHALGYNFMGGNTQVKKRLQGKLKKKSIIPQYLPIDKLDLISVYHDIAYMSEDNNIRRIADAKFLDSLMNNKDMTKLKNAELAKSIIEGILRERDDEISVSETLNQSGILAIAQSIDSIISNVGF